MAALDLDFEVGPSDERAATTSFKAVVRDFSDLGAATGKGGAVGLVSDGLCGPGN